MQQCNIGLRRLLNTAVACLICNVAFASTPKKAPMETYLVVRGMVCSSCAKTVEKTLKQLVGLNEIQVEIPKARVKVTYDEKRVTPQQMVEALRKMGYQAYLPAR